MQRLRTHFTQDNGQLLLTDVSIAMVKLFYQLRAVGASGERVHTFDDTTCNQLLTTDAQWLVDDKLAQVW